MIEDEVKTQVLVRIKDLLFDETIRSYKEYEFFKSSSQKLHEFLIWKLQPINWEEFCIQIENLVTQQGYQFIPGACDVSNYNMKEKSGYKVVALYKPS